MKLLCEHYSRKEIVDELNVSRKEVEEVIHKLKEHWLIVPVADSSPRRYVVHPAFKEILYRVVDGESVEQAYLEYFSKKVHEFERIIYKIDQKVSDIVDILTSHRLSYLLIESLEKASRLEQELKNTDMRRSTVRREEIESEKNTGK